MEIRPLSCHVLSPGGAAALGEAEWASGACQGWLLQPAHRNVIQQPAHTTQLPWRGVLGLKILLGHGTMTCTSTSKSSARTCP